MVSLLGNDEKVTSEYKLAKWFFEVFKDVVSDSWIIFSYLRSW